MIDMGVNVYSLDPCEEMSFVDADGNELILRVVADRAGVRLRFMVSELAAQLDIYGFAMLCS